MISKYYIDTGNNQLTHISNLDSNVKIGRLALSIIKII